MQQNPLILALDLDNYQEALAWVNRLYPKVKIFKVGLQLYSAYGPGIVQDIQKIGAKVFLDLKLNDIPNTMASATRQLLKQKVAFFTVHSLAGAQALKEVARLCRNTSTKTLAVTLLTSLKQDFLKQLSIQRPLEEEVLYLAKLSKRCGLSGVVCSVKEAKILRKALGKNFLIVTPGIRPKGFFCADQQRVATAQEAKEAGVDYIVVGRPILKAKNPQMVIQEMLKQLN